MWQLYIKCKTLGQLPSQLRKITNDLAAYQFDNAVVFMGLTIENALQEREGIGVGNQKEWRQKYTLPQLLDPDFRLDAPKSTFSDKPGGIGALKAMQGMKLWREKGAA